MALLDIQNLTFTYAGCNSPVLQAIDLQVQKGEFLLLCGASGCGKTTLLQLLKKQLSPNGTQSGEILFDGTRITEMEERDSVRRIGYVRQDPDAQIVCDRVWHELAFALESLGEPTDRIRRKVAEICSFFGIGEWYHQTTDTLSGGQKQILALASVMACEPDLLILDEPTAMLDPIAATHFLACVRRIHAEFGTTVILAEHRLEELFSACDRIAWMDAGRMLFSATPRETLIKLSAHSQPERYLPALPSAVRLFWMLKGEGDCPLTVRDGAQFLRTHFQNAIRSLDQAPLSTSSKPVAISIEDGYFRYTREGTDVLRGVSLSVYEGEHLCILGANGVGKSTLLRVLGGVSRLWKGKYRLWGKKLREFSPKVLYESQFAWLPQDPKTLFVHDTVEADLKESTSLRSLSAAEAEARIEDICEQLSIKHLRGRHPYDLSGGERQRAAVAKLLLREPKILLLDEPTKGLDAYDKERLASILTAWKGEGRVIVTVTHDVEFAAAFADRCALFFDGQVISAEAPVPFFSGNRFYTTAARRMTYPYYENTVTVEMTATLCLQNGRIKEAELQ